MVGIIVIGSTLIIGITLGSIAGYFGGLIDEVIMRVTDIFLAFPALILAMAITVALGPSINSVMIALIIVTWPSYTRLIRGDILAVREEDRRKGKKDRREDQGNGSASVHSAETGKDRSGSPWSVIPSTR